MADSDDILTRLRRHTYVDMRGQEHVDKLAADAAEVIERLAGELAEANNGWSAACAHNRALSDSYDKLRQRIAEMHDIITDLELRVVRGDG